MSKSFETVDLDLNRPRLNHTVPCNDDRVHAELSHDPACVDERLAIIGLGYVGLPVAVAFAAKCDHVVGFDVSEPRIEALNAGHDWTGEIADYALGDIVCDLFSRRNESEGDNFFHRHRSYAGELRTPPRSVAAPVRLPHDRTPPHSRSRRCVRIDGFSRCDRGGVRSRA